MGVFIKDTKVKEIEMDVKKCSTKIFIGVDAKFLVCGRFNDRKKLQFSDRFNKHFLKVC